VPNLKVLPMLAWVCCACAAPRVTPDISQDDAYPDPPRLDLSGKAFLLRQHVVAHHTGHQEGSFDAVLQKSGAEVLLIGLTPFGTKAFELARNEGGLHFKSYVPMKLPFPPRYIFDDIARTYFSGLAGTPLSDGVRTAEVGGEWITEQWKNGRLVTRQFVRAAGRPEGEIRIDYGGGMVGKDSPRVIELDNGWIGYHLTIVTLSEQSL
jgi:hypothetical protein